MESGDPVTSDKAAVMWATLRCIEPLTTGITASDGKLAPATFAGRNEQYIVKSNEFANGSSFSVMSETFVLGRASSCNLSIRYNKLVSGKHCRILKSKEGDVWLEDTSTNGTLVNKNKKVMKDKVPLNHGDIFHLVYKNSEISENLGFKFELIGAEEEEPTQQYEDDAEQEITPVKEIQAERESQKRGASPSTSDSVHRKKLNLDKDEEEEEDEMGDTLLCIICQDIFHDCVSLQPCMHSFCSGCYSEWMATSNECPCCRLKVERISKNHLVNNLVESYLKKNPMKKRSESDVKELDAKNKITHDMLYKRQVSSGSGSRASTPASGSPSPTPPAMIVNYNPALAAGIYNSANVISFGARRTICRQCPPPLVSQDSSGSSCGACVAGTPAPGPSTCADAATANASQPSDGAAATAATAAPTAPAYVCVPHQNHILCMCCLQPMPDRRAQRALDPTISPQQCTICYRFHCHAYWTCPKADCLGCLGKFGEMNFGRKCLTSILLDNRHESDILKNYLDNKGIGVNDMLRECIAKMQAGEFSSTDSNRGALNADTVLCYKCGYRNLQELAYHYRVAIPDADLPAAVTSRTKCYWGKGCRTQKHKPHHAANFNHICDASRTGS